jgi:hypothetical protein
MKAKNIGLQTQLELSKFKLDSSEMWRECKEGSQGAFESLEKKFESRLQIYITQIHNLETELSGKINRGSWPRNIVGIFSSRVGSPQSGKIVPDSKSEKENLRRNEIRNFFQVEKKIFFSHSTRKWSRNFSTTTISWTKESFS